MSMKINKTMGPIKLPYGATIEKMEVHLEFETKEEYQLLKEEERKDAQMIMEIFEKLKPMFDQLMDIMEDTSPAPTPMFDHLMGTMKDPSPAPNFYNMDGIPLKFKHPREEATEKPEKEILKMDESWFNYKEKDNKVQLVPVDDDDKDEDCTIESFFSDEDFD